MLQVPVREEEPLCVYRVEVTTGNEFGAGTNSKVLLNLWGIKDGQVSTDRVVWQVVQCVLGSGSCAHGRMYDVSIKNDGSL